MKSIVYGQYGRRSNKAHVPSVDEFKDLPIQFGQVVNAKNFHRCCILPVGQSSAFSQVSS